MTALYLLLADNSSNGSAITLQAQLFDGVRSSHPTLNVKCNHNSTEVTDSAEKGSQAAFDLLKKEGYLSRSLMVRYQLKEAPSNIIGHSGDIAFALSLATSIFHRKLFPVVAATGVLDPNGAVSKVQYISAKLEAVIPKLPKGACIFLASDNRADVPAAVSSHCEEHDIHIHFIDHLEDALSLLGIDIRKFYKGNPYLGLDTFEIQHAGLFFGREEQTFDVIQQLLSRKENGSPSLLLLGASGSGKSSLVQAGLLHTLYNGDAVPATTQIKHGFFRPSQLFQSVGISENPNQGYYSENLKKTLCTHWADALGVEVTKDFLDTSSAIEALKASIAHCALKAPAKQTLFIWVIDQLEELFTSSWNSGEQQTFIELITALPENGIWVIATLRSDFYAQYQKETTLFNHFRDSGQYDLLPPDKAALGSIIRDPAQQAELSFEKDKGISLDEQILSDTNYDSSALPLLEFSLKILYEERDKGNKTLTYNTYKAMGGVQGAIGTWAQKVFDEMPKKDRDQNNLQILIRRLTVVDIEQQTQEGGQAVRVSSRTVALKSLPDTTQALVRGLTQARLLSLVHDSKKQIQVKVTHEALLKNWPLVRQLIERDQPQLALQEQLTQEAQRWQQASEKDKKDLLVLSGARLRKAQALAESWGDALSEDIRTYIKTSYKFSKGRKLKKWGLISSPFLFLGINSLLTFIWITPNTAYYKDFERLYDGPVPLGEELSIEEHLREKNHYKITREGLFRNIIKIQSVDKLDRCPPSNENRLFTWNSYGSEIPYSEICEIHFSYDENDNILFERGYGQNEEQVFTITYLSQQKSSYQSLEYSMTIFYNWGEGENDKLTSISHWAGGNPTHSDNHVHKSTYDYDINFNNIRVTNYGTRGQEKLNKYGYHIKENRFDEENNLIESAFFGIEKEAILVENTFHRFLNEFDQENNLLSKTYFNLEGKYIIFYYDQETNIIQTMNYDKDGQPTLNKLGYHIRINKFDENNNLVESVFLGKDNEPVLAENSYHRVQRDFDQRNSQINITYFDLGAQSVIIDEGVVGIDH